MKCPICSKDSVKRYRPFCSKRCADIDLGKWMSGGYAVPSAEPPDPDEVESAMRDNQERHGKLH